MEFLKDFIPNIHKEGIYFVILGLFIAVILSSFSSNLAIMAVAGCIFIVFFFRDPTRIVTIGKNYIVSPADGVVTKIEESVLPENLGFDGKKKATRISIFLSVFDVHVNRVPADGTIKAMHYHQGKFINAALDKASIHNERQEVLMEMHGGGELVFTQIAGLIARRIVCDLKDGQEVKSGERFGIIRFGSRVDIYLPNDVHPMVFEGSTVKGGETVLADINEKKARKGEIR